MTQRYSETEAFAESASHFSRHIVDPLQAVLDEKVIQKQRNEFPLETPGYRSAVEYDNLQDLRVTLMWSLKSLKGVPGVRPNDSLLQTLHDAGWFLLDLMRDNVSTWKSNANFKHSFALDILELDEFLGERQFISLLSDRAVPMLKDVNNER